MARREPERNLSWLALAALCRSTGVGLSGVLVLLVLVRAGHDPGQATQVLAAGLLGGAAGLLLVTRSVPRWGRRRTLQALSLAQALGGGLLAWLAPSLPLAWLAAFLGMVNGMGRDRGAALALEQAVLPSTAPDAARTQAFARYHVVLDAGHALGALLAGLPTLLAPWLGAGLAGRATLGLLLPLGLLACACHRRLDARAEDGEVARPPPLVPASRRVVARLCALSALDSLGGGFLPNALLALWFGARFGLDAGEVGLLFALGRTANALSYPLAARLAGRIGLVRTMVLTHLPSSGLLLLLPVLPSAAWAVALYLLRELLVEMDLPTRQSFAMAVVTPAERTRVAAATGLARALGWAAGALVAAGLVPHLGLSAPLLVGAGIKIAYDLLLWRSMRHVRPPEERTGRA
jgi:MFS family permease